MERDSVNEQSSVDLNAIENGLTDYYKIHFGVGKSFDHIANWEATIELWLAETRFVEMEMIAIDSQRKKASDWKRALEHLIEKMTDDIEGSQIADAVALGHSDIPFVPYIEYKEIERQKGERPWTDWYTTFNIPDWYTTLRDAALSIIIPQLKNELSGYSKSTLKSIPVKPVEEKIEHTLESSDHLEPRPQIEYRYMMVVLTPCKAGQNL